MLKYLIGLNAVTMGLCLHNHLLLGVGVLAVWVTAATDLAKLLIPGRRMKP